MVATKKRGIVTRRKTRPRCIGAGCDAWVGGFFLICPRLTCENNLYTCSVLGTPHTSIFIEIGIINQPLTYAIIVQQ